MKGYGTLNQLLWKILCYHGTKLSFFSSLPPSVTTLSRFLIRVPIVYLSLSLLLTALSVWRQAPLEVHQKLGLDFPRSRTQVSRSK